MLKSIFGGKKKDPERSAAAKSLNEFNSLVEDQHVDPSNKQHMEVFNQVRGEIDKRKYKSFRIRGLKVENILDGTLTLCKVEVLCYSEDALIEFHKLVDDIKDRF